MKKHYTCLKYWDCRYDEFGLIKSRQQREDDVNWLWDNHISNGDQGFSSLWSSKDSCICEKRLNTWSLNRINFDCIPQSLPWEPCVLLCLGLCRFKSCLSCLPDSQTLIWLFIVNSVNWSPRNCADGRNQAANKRSILNDIPDFDGDPLRGLFSNSDPFWSTEIIFCINPKTRSWVILLGNTVAVKDCYNRGNFFIHPLEGSGGCPLGIFHIHSKCGNVRLDFNFSVTRNWNSIVSAARLWEC